MLNKVEYKEVRRQIASYWETLKLPEIREEYKKKGLLTQNAKLAKGSNYNIGLELLSANLAPKVNTCKAAGSCRYSCLVFAGVGNILKGKSMLEKGQLTNPLKAKTRRTFFFAKSLKEFEELIRYEIREHAKKAKKAGKLLGVRLNTTSDIDWRFITDTMKDVNFYDYTKVWDRESTDNYNLTFSASENTSDQDCLNKLKCGQNVAKVFYGKLPDTWLGYPVVNGDVDDSRYGDQRGVVVGLKAKGTIGGYKGKASKFIVKQTTAGDG